MLNRRRYFPFRDYSIPIFDPIHTNGSDEELEQAILRKMRTVHVLVVMAGVYATYSRWINFELDIAKNGFTHPKPVLAVAPWGQVNLSSRVKKEADHIVGWKTESIIKGIRALY